MDMDLGGVYSMFSLIVGFLFVIVQFELLVG